MMLNIIGILLLIVTGSAFSVIVLIIGHRISWRNALILLAGSVSLLIHGLTLGLQLAVQGDDVLVQRLSFAPWLYNGDLLVGTYVVMFGIAVYFAVSYYNSHLKKVPPKDGDTRESDDEVLEVTRQGNDW